MSVYVLMQGNDPDEVQGVVIGVFDTLDGAMARYEEPFVRVPDAGYSGAWCAEWIAEGNHSNTVIVGWIIEVEVNA